MTNPTMTHPAAIVSRRDFLRTGTAATLGPAALSAADRDRTQRCPPGLVGGERLGRPVRRPVVHPPELHRLRRVERELERDQPRRRPQLGGAAQSLPDL